MNDLTEKNYFIKLEKFNININV